MLVQYVGLYARRLLDLAAPKSIDRRPMVATGTVTPTFPSHADRLER